MFIDMRYSVTPTKRDRQYTFGNMSIITSQNISSWVFVRSSWYRESVLPIVVIDEDIFMWSESGGICVRLIDSKGDIVYGSFVNTL